MWESNADEQEEQIEENVQNADDEDDFGDDFDEFAEGGEGDEDFGDFDEADDEPAPSQPPPSQFPATPDILKGLVSRIPSLAYATRSFIPLVERVASVGPSLIPECCSHLSISPPAPRRTKSKGQ